MLDAVAAFMYGMTRIVDAFERHELGEPDLPPSRGKDPEP